jgi:hypothetical protein
MADAGRFEVKNFEGFVCLRIAEQRRRFWTPRLTLGLYGEADGSTRIEGVYGPSANVWSIFLYSYLLSGLVAMFSGFFGLAQWLVGEPRAWGLWIFGGALLVVTCSRRSARNWVPVGCLSCTWPTRRPWAKRCG